MRLADAVFRGGHLSEGALVEAVMTGERPVHLERCDLCAERAVDLGRWLDQVRVVGLEASEAAFPPERLAAQQVQIMRRLEQLDSPARVIAFPNQYRLGRESGGRRVAPAWVGVAAAAGLAIGVISGQLTAHLGIGPAKVNQASAQQPVEAPPDRTPGATLFGSGDDDQDRAQPASLRGLDGATPTMAPTRMVSARFEGGS